MKWSQVRILPVQPVYEGIMETLLEKQIRILKNNLKQIFNHGARELGLSDKELTILCYEAINVTREKIQADQRVS